MKVLVLLFKQRLVVWMLGVFLSLVLFNTTYMHLGTIVPLTVMVLSLFHIIFHYRIKITGNKCLFLIFITITLVSTFFSGGDDYREIFKILITIIIYMVFSSIRYADREVRFISLLLCLSYLVYAILVITSIGLYSEDYGRVNIRILGGDIPLDPNVTAAVFPLPIIICLYNFLYGKLKILSAFSIVLFLVGILACGSRGSFLGIIGVGILLIQYLFSRRIGFFSKFVFLTILLYAIYYALFYAISDDTIFGLERILDYGGDDASNGRTTIWMKRISLIMDSPIIGYGANYNIGTIHSACHNTFLQVLYYGGLVGFCCFLVPVVKVLYQGRVDKFLRYALIFSVFLPIFFIDTLQERTLWNFLIFFDIMSKHNEGEIIWFKKQ